MITGADLANYIATLKEAGVTGRVKLGDIEFEIKPAVAELKSSDAPPAVPRSAKADYDRMLFAATEGIPEDEATS
jgi:hypothetical protein